MHRAATALLVITCLVFPRAARAENDSPLGWIQDWFWKLGQPQRPPPPPPPEDLGARNTFTLNPLALQQQQLGVEYEHAFGRAFSLYAAPEFAYGSAAGAWQFTAGGTGGIRIFVLGSAPSGIYFGPEVSVLYQRAYRDETIRKALGLGLGGSVGWTLVLFNRFAVSAGFSALLRSVPELSSPAGEVLRVELLPLPRLAFGVAF